MASSSFVELSAGRGVNSHCAPPAEIIAWHYLRRVRHYNLRLVRNKVIGEQLYDFICITGSLLVELDLPEAPYRSSSDRERIAEAERLGLMVLSFKSSEVYADMDAVANRIIEASRARANLRPLDITKGFEKYDLRYEDEPLSDTPFSADQTFSAEAQLQPAA